MTTRPDPALIAAGKLRLSRAIAVLLRTHPFHAHVAAGWRARPDATIETIGVCWACGGVQLVWSPEFVSGISEAELAGVLLHEVHHVVLRHPFLFPEQANPGPDFDLHAAIVAEEVTVNEFVSLPLPGEPLRLEEFATECPQLAPGQSTRERYRLLCDPARARRDHEIRETRRRCVEEQLRDWITRTGGRLPDSHAGWESFRRAGAAAALAVSVATAQALSRHGSSLSPELMKLIRAAHAGSGAPGSASLGLLETLAGTATARLPWQRILRRLLAVDFDVEPTYLRPPRRFPELVGVLPGSRRVARKRRVMAAIDTSGSMSAEVLDEIAAELRVMSRSYDVSVVEFDVAIQRRYRLRRATQPGSRRVPNTDSPSRLAAVSGTPVIFGDPLSAMQGRGGTSFFPVFERDTLAWAADGGDLSGIVVFTDGCGPAPDEPPPLPVIWILAGFGVRKPTRWGSAVDTTAKPHACARAMEPADEIDQML